MEGCDGQAQGRPSYSWSYEAGHMVGLEDGDAGASVDRLHVHHVYLPSQKPSLSMAKAMSLQYDHAMTDLLLNLIS